MEKSSETIPIYRAMSRIEANVIKNLLEENGITCVIELSDGRSELPFVENPYSGEAVSHFVLRILETNKTPAENLIKSYLQEEENRAMLGLSEPLTNEKNEKGQPKKLDSARRRITRITAIGVLLLFLFTAVGVVFFDTKIITCAMIGLFPLIVIPVVIVGWRTAFKNHDKKES